MVYEFKVSEIESKLDIVKRFQQTPRCEAQLHREVINKIGLVEGDLIEVTGGRTTVARVASIDNDDFYGDIIGLSSLVRNNARVSLKDAVTIRKVDANAARRIVLAPIGKHLKKSELLKIVAKKSFQEKAFLEGDVTYLRSKIMSYILGSVTWMRIVKTDPAGVVVASADTEFEVLPDPVEVNRDALKYLPDLDLEDDLSEKDLSLDEDEWAKINTLLELGLFKSLAEVIAFFLREGIRARRDIFEKSVTVMEQLRQLKKNVKS